MAALRWFFFALVCFGGGTAAGFAAHPPQLGIPDPAAADLRGRLAKVQQYASEGRCDAVKGQLSGAQSTISKLPENTAVTVEQSLRTAVEKLRTEAISECLRVAASREQMQADAQATPTPSATPTPEPQETPTPAPQPTSPDGGAPDPGTGEGTNPEAPSSEGGAAIPGDAGAAVEQGINEARERYRHSRDKLRGAWQHVTEGAQG